MSELHDLLRSLNRTQARKIGTTWVLSASVRKFEARCWNECCRCRKMLPSDEICSINLRNYLRKWYTEVDSMCIINILAKLIHQADGDVITDIVHNTVDLVVWIEIFITDLRTSSMPYKLNDWWCWKVRRNSESFDFAFCRRVPSSSGTLLSSSSTGIISLFLNCYCLQVFWQNWLEP